MRAGFGATAALSAGFATNLALTQRGFVTKAALTRRRGCDERGIRRSAGVATDAALTQRRVVQGGGQGGRARRPAAGSRPA